MTALEQVRMLWDHLVWADTAILDALGAQHLENDDALREYSHIIGATETWLARLEGRPPTLVVWPDIPRNDIPITSTAVHTAFGKFISELKEGDLDASVAYTNTAGRSFTSRVSDILLHVVTHGQYHRGKINLILRQTGRAPAPADYISFVRGVPAATSPRP